MRKLKLLIVCLFSVMSVFGQNENKNLNLILVINDAVWISYTSLKIEIKDEAGSVNRVINGEYYPGNLSFEKEDYEKLLATDDDSMTLIISYKEHDQKKTKDLLFELPFSSGWFDNYFMVMRIYDLDKKKYKGVFEPLDNERNYTYELDYPGGQMLRIRNKGKENRE